MKGQAEVIAIVLFLTTMGFTFGYITARAANICTVVGVHDPWALVSDGD